MTEQSKRSKMIDVVCDIAGRVPSVSECFNMARKEFALADLTEDEVDREMHLSRRDHYVYMAAMPVFRDRGDDAAAIDWMLADLMEEAGDNDRAPHNLPLYVRFLTQLRGRLT